MLKDIMLMIEGGGLRVRCSRCGWWHQMFTGQWGPALLSDVLDEAVNHLCDPKQELVAEADGKAGCPVLSSYGRPRRIIRCSMGRDVCAQHGRFNTRPA